MHRRVAIAAFIAAGVMSSRSFVSVTSLPMLNGAGNNSLKKAIALGWISVFPTWIGLFRCLMALVAIVEELIQK